MKVRKNHTLSLKLDISMIPVSFTTCWRRLKLAVEILSAHAVILSIGEIAAAAAREPHRKRVWFFRTFIMENSSQTIHET